MAMEPGTGMLNRQSGQTPGRLETKSLKDIHTYQVRPSW
jgi:hypothetical protein